MRVVLLTALFLISNQHSLLAQSKAESAVLNLSLQKFEWLISKQADLLEQLLDERIMYVHSNGWVQSKQEIMDDMHTGKLIYRQVTINDARVRVYANTAIVIGTGRFSGSREGNEFDLDLFYTEVYVRQGKKWILASRHSNRLP